MANPLLPPPGVGEVIYLPSALYLSHGRDDFQGGLCTVSAVRPGISGGELTTFINVRERPRHSYNWFFLAPEQEKLRAQYGDQVGHVDPDYRAEFNEIYG